MVAYFSAIGLRLSDIFGVSSSPPGSHTAPTMVKRLICSTRESLVLPAFTAACTSSTISRRRTRVGRSASVAPRSLARRATMSGSSTIRAVM
ncbi:Uncharacterised protein [Mycobacteroides abscessus subsp. abscessus]|nr:Uncharacterised protein [Mycobacteroides abscessus subsp. abscessus]